MKEYIVRYQNKDNPCIKGIAHLECDNGENAIENTFCALRKSFPEIPYGEWEFSAEENTFQAVAEKVSNIFVERQAKELGFVLLTIKPRPHTPRSHEKYEVCLIENPFLRENAIAQISDYARKCIEQAFAENDMKLTWNNTGTIFWQKKR